MNLYLAEVKELGIYSVVASDRSQCKELLEAEFRRSGTWVCSDDINDAVEKAQWFSLNTAVNWDAGISHFYQ